MQLPEDFREILRKALSSAFPDPEGFATLVDDANLKNQDDQQLRFQHIWGRGTYSDAINSLLIALTATGQLGRLCRTAVRKNPRNSDLASAVAPILGFLNPVERVLGSDGDAVADGLEAIVTNVPFAAAVPWVDQLRRLLPSVCRLEPQPEQESRIGFGTGFLVAPDVVMTAAHNVTRFAASQEQAQRVVCRFGYYQLTRTDPIPPGVEVRLAQTDWLLALGQPGLIDVALLRLERRVGDDPIDGASREIFQLARGAVQDRTGHVIPQHPAARPLELSLGGVNQQYSTSRHIAYHNNTEPGSSGSPCLNQNLQVAAVHFKGTDQRNYGVRVDAFLDWLREPAQQKARERLTAAGLQHWWTP